MFRRGASFANVILFEFASTNLVFELGIVLLVLLGWQFVAAEFAGGLPWPRNREPKAPLSY